MVMVWGEFGGRNDMGGIVAGRMGVHFVVLMVLVGLLEASIAARREQDYYCLPIEWKLHYFGGVLFFTVRITLSFLVYYYS